MKDEQDFVVPLAANDLEGLPDFVIASAKQAAIDAKSSHEYCINLSRSIVTPFLIFSSRRDLREQIFKKWTQRGELSPERDNKLIAKEILLLRDEQARMHSTRCFSEYQLLDTMAKSSNNVMDLLLKVCAHSLTYLLTHLHTYLLTHLLTYLLFTRYGSLPKYQPIVSALSLKK
jgi:peptidyl-dipeptidase Dcp